MSEYDTLRQLTMWYGQVFGVSDSQDLWAAIENSPSRHAGDFYGDAMMLSTPYITEGVAPLSVNISAWLGWSLKKPMVQAAGVEVPYGVATHGFYTGPITPTLGKWRAVVISAQYLAVATDAIVDENAIPGFAKLHHGVSYRVTMTAEVNTGQVTGLGSLVNSEAAQGAIPLCAILYDGSTAEVYPIHKYCKTPGGFRNYERLFSRLQKPGVFLHDLGEYTVENPYTPAGTHLAVIDDGADWYAWLGFEEDTAWAVALEAYGETRIFTSYMLPYNSGGLTTEYIPVGTSFIRLRLRTAEVLTGSDAIEALENGLCSLYMYVTQACAEQPFGSPPPPLRSSNGQWGTFPSTARDIILGSVYWDGVNPPVLTYASNPPEWSREVMVDQTIPSYGYGYLQQLTITPPVARDITVVTRRDNMQLVAGAGASYVTLDGRDKILSKAFGKIVLDTTTPIAKDDGTKLVLASSVNPAGLICLRAEDPMRAIPTAYEVATSEAPGSDITYLPIAVNRVLPYDSAGTVVAHFQFDPYQWERVDTVEILAVGKVANASAPARLSIVNNDIDEPISDSAVMVTTATMMQVVNGPITIGSDPGNMPNTNTAYRVDLSIVGVVPEDYLYLNCLYLKITHS